MKNLLKASLVGIVLAQPLFADDAAKKSKKSAGEKVSNRADEISDDLDSYSTGHYGMAGCGLGSIVITKDTKAQIFAATTNGTFYSQLFGITSGTSNCMGRASKKMAYEQEVFIENNFAQLSAQAARGEGEHLNAFAELLGCDRQELRSFSQANHDAMFASSNPENVLHVVRSGLAGRCERAG